jgi:hypothetical protein
LAGGRLAPFGALPLGAAGKNFAAGHGAMCRCQTLLLEYKKRGARAPF